MEQAAIGTVVSFRIKNYFSRMKRTALFAALLLSIAACKKNDPEPTPPKVYKEVTYNFQGQDSWFMKKGDGTIVLITNQMKKDTGEAVNDTNGTGDQFSNVFRTTMPVGMEAYASINPIDESQSTDLDYVTFYSTLDTGRSCHAFKGGKGKKVITDIVK